MPHDCLERLRVRRHVRGVHGRHHHDGVTHPLGVAALPAHDAVDPHAALFGLVQRANQAFLGTSELFLDWTPRYASDVETAEYDVFRAVGSGELAQVNAAPLVDESFFDPAPPAGKLRYEIRVRGGAVASRQHLALVWPPAPTHGLAVVPVPKP